MSTSTEDGGRKRARSEEPQPSSASETARVKDEHFWYEDGTVILVAKNVEFRVYKGILADHSPVFKDMFSFPQPPESAMLECAVVEVTDSPEDLRHVLRVYMPKKGPSPFVPDDPSFNTISATIRLGHKYQMTDLVEHSMAYLTRYYTDFEMFSSQPGLYGPPSFSDTHAIGVVNLARLTEQQEILPGALLACCNLNGEIVRDLRREDGTVESLSSADLGLCFRAKNTLSAQAIIIYMKIFNPDGAPAACVTGCLKKFGPRLSQVEKSAPTIISHLPFLSIEARSHNLQEVFCAPCLREVRKRDLKARTRLWKSLPEVFGIETTPTTPSS